MMEKCQCLKYFYIRTSLIEMKGAALTSEIKELLPVMVEYVRRHIVYQCKCRRKHNHSDRVKNQISPELQRYTTSGTAALGKLVKSSAITLLLELLVNGLLYTGRSFLALMTTESALQYSLCPLEGGTAPQTPHPSARRTELH